MTLNQPITLADGCKMVVEVIACGHNVAIEVIEWILIEIILPFSSLSSHFFHI